MLEFSEKTKVMLAKLPQESQSKVMTALKQLLQKRVKAMVLAKAKLKAQAK